MFQVTDLQACEPMELFRDKPAGIALRFDAELDSMGFDRVTVAAADRDALIDFVRDNWGNDEETGGWFTEYVLDRIEDVPTITDGERLPIGYADH
jgi:hypothetical protein